MTNAQIIFMESCRLLEEGVIGTTGRKLVMEMPDGTKKDVTYNGKRQSIKL